MAPPLESDLNPDRETVELDKLSIKTAIFIKTIVIMKVIKHSIHKNAIASHASMLGIRGTLPPPPPPKRFPWKSYPNLVLLHAMGM
jgi:hypothetical protein